VDATGLQDAQSECGGACEPQSLFISPAQTGISAKQARADIATLGAARGGSNTEKAGGPNLPLQDFMIRTYPRAHYGDLDVRAGFVLLIACANMRLLLARAAGSGKEMHSQGPSGGPRANDRQLLTEAGLIALLGGALVLH